MKSYQILLIPILLSLVGCKCKNTVTTDARVDAGIVQSKVSKDARLVENLEGMWYIDDDGVCLHLKKKQEGYSYEGLQKTKYDTFEEINVLVKFEEGRKLTMLLSFFPAGKGEHGVQIDTFLLIGKAGPEWKKIFFDHATNISMVSNSDHTGYKIIETNLTSTWKKLVTREGLEKCRCARSKLESL